MVVLIGQSWDGSDWLAILVIEVASGWAWLRRSLLCHGWISSILVDSLVSLECGSPTCVVEVYGGMEERGREY